MKSDIASQIRAALDAYTDSVLDSRTAEQPDTPQRRVEQHSWLRRWAGPIAAAVVVAAVIAGTFAVRAQVGEHTNRTAATARMSSEVRAKLWSIARSWADDNGDKGAITAAAVATSRSRAENFREEGSGNDASDQSGVWVLQIHGAFVCNVCKGPPGSSITGNTITVIMDRTTYAESGFSVGDDNSPDLSTLGTVIFLTAPP